MTDAQMSIGFVGSLIPLDCFQNDGRIKRAFDAETEGQTDTSGDEGRVLHLSGKWHKPLSEFMFEAVVFVQSDGSAEGFIHWRNVQTVGVSATFSAYEKVRGDVSRHHVELRGYQAEPGLATDYYKIALVGSDQTGIFNGMSRAFGDWSVRMTGSYLFSAFTR